MSRTLKAGSRLYSAACTTEVIVVKAPPGEVALTIGGAAPVDAADERPEAPAVAAGHEGPTVVGKRYVDEAGTIEVLCTKAGHGAVALDGEALGVKDAKQLPSSD